MWEWEASQALELQSGPAQTGVGGKWDSPVLRSFLPALHPLSNLWVCRIFRRPGKSEWGRVVGALRSSAPLPPQHELTLVFVMSAGEGHHVVFLAPSPSFLPQSKFVLLFDLNTYPWLWTRESGQWEKGQGKPGMGWGPGGLGKAEFWYFPPTV